MDHTKSPMNLEQVGDLALSEQREKGNCLVIVNTKSWAVGLYRYCSEKKDEERVSPQHVNVRSPPDGHS